MNRFLRLDTLTPRTLWENVREDVVLSEHGYVLFDDVVLDPWRAKDHSREARLVRRQWSGNEKRVIYGIGVVTCVYVNPETEQFWVIDFRVYDPWLAKDDLQSKIESLARQGLEMLDNVLQKKLSFTTVLMDSWYASMRVIKHIEALEKLYYCPKRIVMSMIARASKNISVWTSFSGARKNKKQASPFTSRRCLRATV
jgi:hypothetical protein